jgi:predicted permease
MALGRWGETIRQDLRYGARQLRLDPGFAAVAVLSLVLGIGANTAIFQLVDAVRLRSLPVRAPQELVSVDFQPGAMRSGWSSTRSAALTYPLWDEIRKRQQVFSGMVAWSEAQFNLASGGEARYAQGLYVSGGFFEVLGVPAVVGRTFTEADDPPTCPSPGAVISHSFWQREFGADPRVVGRTVRLDGRAFPIVGITPASFFGVEVGSRFDVAIPLCADSLLAPLEIMRRIPRRDAWWLSVMGRLKPGWTVRQAQAEFQVLAPGIMQATLPPSYRPDGAKRYLANRLAVSAGATGVSQLRRQYETPLWLLLATAGLVLLIACANLANLLLARASVREREIAVRQAIGAPRSRLIVQLLAESLLVATLGTAIGAAFAQVLSRALIAFLSTPNDPVFVGIGMDWNVLAFTAGMAISTCLLFGLLPALRATQVAPAAAMRAGGRGSSAGRERFALRRMLVATQVALSMVLLVGALLFVRSLRNLVTLDPGFRPEGVVAVDLNLNQEHYSQEKAAVVTRDLLERIRSVPGVLSAAEVNIWPISGFGWNGPVYLASDPIQHRVSFFTQVGPGYFRTMGTPLLAGRDFGGRDTAGSPRVAIVNQAFARMVFGGANPVGRSFRTEAPAGQADSSYEVVGLVRNAKYRELREEYLPIAYLAAGQEMNQAGPSTVFAVRTNGPPRDTLGAVKAAVAGVSPAIGIEFHVLTERIEETLLRDRLMAALSGTFGLLAGLLSTLGLYGVIAYMVARRRNEIGVRMALGADRGRVVRLVLRETALLLLVGLMIGTGLALWLGRAATALLYGLKPYDPPALAGATGMLAAVGILASYGPALRASRLHPMDALREE